LPLNHLCVYLRLSVYVFNVCCVLCVTRERSC
jgi:hypothetical protein